MVRSKNKYNITFIIGILLIIICAGILVSEYFRQKKLDAFDKMNIALFESEIPDIIETDEEIPDVGDIEQPSDNEPDENQPNVPNKKPTPVDYSKYYVGTLEIPKINLKKGFLEIDSPYNNVDRNVTVIQTSSYPDVDKGNFILAAHTGSSSISFFTRLHDLQLGDLAYIKYKQKKYTYKLVDIYTQPKVGMISIYRDTNKTTLTLVTCTKGTQATQTIFILELISVE